MYIKNVTNPKKIILATFFALERLKTIQRRRRSPSSYLVFTIKTRRYI